MGNLMLVCIKMQQNGWALQLLSVACLSLGAKMEETLVPTLLDLQVVELIKISNATAAFVSSLGMN